MRRALRLVAALLISCGGASATSAGAPRVAAVSAERPTILLNEGGVFRPIDNGGRVAIPGGWATVEFSPLPLTRSDVYLDVAVLDPAGKPVGATVSVSYEMVLMDHGTYSRQASMHGGRHRMPISIVMPGKWQFAIAIDRNGTVTRFLVVVPEIG
ncbi:MAG: hypothetical protein FJ028_03825 [Chloroflexi bacterium]|nr:hypothetical protein [Chloroflexota bacterium]